MNTENKPPKISVVLPTYNGMRWLRESVESVIAQTEKDWELIIVDDGSRDDTLKIAEALAVSDSRISVIANKTNKKLPATLNVGFSAARGKYLTWTSDDNLFRPHALETMAGYLEAQPQADMVSTNMDCIGEDGEFIRDYHGVFSHVLHPALLIISCNVSAAFMYRRTIADKIGEYDVNTFCAEDYDYWCRISLAGRIDYMSDNTYQYRIQSQSLSVTKKAQVDEKVRYIKKKYTDAFFEKYRFGYVDRAKTYALTKQPAPLGYRVPCAFFWLQNKVAALPLFWNTLLSRKLRRFLELKLSFPNITNEKHNRGFRHAARGDQACAGDFAASKKS